MTPAQEEISARNGLSLVGSTDWLGSEPLFFEPESGQASTSLPSLTPPRVAPEDLDEEGLANFLDYGYSVLGKTPLKRVRFLPANTNLWRDANGLILKETLPDPFFGQRRMMPEADVIEMIRSRVQEWERNLPSDQEIVLPLSGGLDSRLLLWSLRDKERIRAFTYGTSPKQAQSFEVVYARALAEKFALRWEHIELGYFHNRLSAWNQEFGLATHAHGMYQIEFYEQILEKLEGPKAVLSGVVGDVWAGSIRPLQINGVDELYQLFYTHGLHADSSKLLLSPPDSPLMHRFWRENAENLPDARFQTVTIIRQKMMLLTYLLKIPRSMGFEVWSPFLEPEIALAMLDIKGERRSDRVWQKDFFAKEGLLPQQSAKSASTRNDLNAQATRNVPLRPLSAQTLEEVLAGDYVGWVNRFVADSRSTRLQNKLLSTPKLGGALRKLGLSQSARAYAAYLCLYPLHIAMGGED